MKRKKLGEILQDRGKISAANLQKLFEEQQSKMVRLGEIILERDLVDKASLVKAIEEVSRVPYLDCAAVQCDQKALQSVPRAMAMRLVVTPRGSADAGRSSLLPVGRWDRRGVRRDAA
jgi:type IV pilus assembly protein PilB